MALAPWRKEFTFRTLCALSHGTKLSAIFFRNKKGSPFYFHETKQVQLHLSKRTRSVSAKCSLLSSSQRHIKGERFHWSMDHLQRRLLGCLPSSKGLKLLEAASAHLMLPNLIGPAPASSVWKAPPSLVHLSALRVCHPSKNLCESLVPV